jgi:hypothetical protein
MPPAVRAAVADKPTRAERLYAADLARALAPILHRYREHCATRATGQPWQDHRLSDFADVPSRPGWQGALDEMELDPVRFVLKAEAREVGWRAYAYGGLDFMRQVFDRAKLDSRSAGTLDHWWNGIGWGRLTWET